MTNIFCPWKFYYSFIRGHHPCLESQTRRRTRTSPVKLGKGAAWESLGNQLVVRTAPAPGQCLENLEAEREVLTVYSFHCTLCIVATSLVVQ